MHKREGQTRGGPRHKNMKRRLLRPGEASFVCVRVGPGARRERQRGDDERAKTKRERGIGACSGGAGRTRERRAANRTSRERAPPRYTRTASGFLEKIERAPLSTEPVASAKL